MNKLFTAAALTILLITTACVNPFSKDKDTQQDQNDTVQITEPKPVEIDKNSHRVTPVVEAVKKIENSIVNIRTEKVVTRQSPFFNQNSDENFLNDFFGFGRKYKTQSLGSGVMIKSDGTIITNYHVVKEATKVYVMLADNKTHEAEYLGGDEILDIAVLKIKEGHGEFTSAVTGDSDGIMLGETVIAMGNPYGLSNSITTGIVSSKNRIINIGNGYSVFIQTDALINPGNSGGPLVNLDGEVIGINTAIFKEAQGIGFSIPINTVLRILPEILEHGKVRMGYMGFTIQEVKDDEGIRLVVTRVERKSNANYIGIETGDEILQVADIPVSSLSAMSYLLRSYPPGSSVTVAIKRGEKTLRGKMAISGYPENYGLEILRNNFGMEFEQKGKYLVITDVSGENFFRKGDILIGIGNEEIKDAKDLNQLIIDNLGEIAILSIYRDSNLIRVKLPL